LNIANLVQKKKKDFDEDDNDRKDNRDDDTNHTYDGEDSQDLSHDDSTSDLYGSSGSTLSLTQLNLDQIEADRKFMNSLVYGVSCEQGDRSSMEDAHQIIKNFESYVHEAQQYCQQQKKQQPQQQQPQQQPQQQQPKQNHEDNYNGFGVQSFCGVYDGHLGVEAAQYCEKYLAINIAHHLLEQSDICEAMRLGCLQTDREFIKYAQKEKLDSGTVLVLTLLTGKQLSIANAGDCRAVLCRAGKAIELTRDHTPTSFEEKQRIEKEGASLDCESLGGLDVSRSLGDIDPDTGFKIKGLTAEPETCQMYITDDDEFVLIACDGLWDVMNSEVAIKLARNSLREDNIFK